MNVLVHTFGMGDVEDLDLYAKMHIGEWTNTTERGQWLHEHARGWEYRTEPDTGDFAPEYGWIVELYCTLDPDELTYYYLRWPEVDQLNTTV